MMQSAARCYLLDLDSHVRTGVRHLPEGFVARQAAYVRSTQNRDGGFPGRDGASDLYYTSFALRTAHACGGLTKPALWQSVARYLNGACDAPGTIVDCFCCLGIGQILPKLDHRH